VREVLAMVQKVSGKKLNIVEGPRRAGDAAQLVAEASKAKNALGWKPACDELETICASAYRWETGFRSTNARGVAQVVN
jgi:UDP-glucose 4-epimerase